MASTSRTRRRRLSDEARILALFGDPEESYSRAEVTRLTCTSSRELDEILHQQSVIPRDDGTFAWKDVAFLATERWGVRRIASVLLRNKQEVPPLSQLVRIRIELPAYQLYALKREAVRKTTETSVRWGISDILTTVLSAWVASQRDDRTIADPDDWPL